MKGFRREDRFKRAPGALVGLVVPGLGHLWMGEWIHGVGLVSLWATWLWAALAGFPRYGELLFPTPDGHPDLHAIVALLSWFGLAGALWWAAWRRVHPRVLDEDEWNSNWQIFLRQMVRHRTGMLGWYGILVLVAFTLLTPLIAPFDPSMLDAGPKNTPPNLTFLMGTDEYGRDVFSRLLYGGRISLSIGFIAVAIAATLGTTLGATAAFFLGVTDRALMWLTDLLLSLPRLVLLLAIIGLVHVKGSQGLFVIVVILGLTGWMGVARIVRGQVLALKQQEFIQAAAALGYSNLRIVFRHLIPNAIAPVIVYCSLAIGGTMLAEASLSFLGLGVQPPTSTWGVMVNDGRDPLRVAPWIATFPGLAIVAAVMSFNLLGDGLRDALDPKLR